jgi:hypothetical protein
VERDKRTDAVKLDLINYSLMNPFTVGKIIHGIDWLKYLQVHFGHNADTYKHGGCLITQSALQDGLSLYTMAVDRYIGNNLIKQLTGDANVDYKTDDNVGIWLDISGLFVPQKELDRIIYQIEQKNLTGIDGFQAAFTQLFDNYEKYEWLWTLEVINGFYPLKDRDLKNILKRWKDASIQLDEMVCKDIEKEYSDNMTSLFGFDGGESDRKADFANLRGLYEDNLFVKNLRRNINQYEYTYTEIMKLLELLPQKAADFIECPPELPVNLIANFG